MSSDNVLLTVAVIAVAMSLVGLIAVSIGFSGIDDLMFSPNQTEAANVTITIEQNLAILFTNWTITFGTGSVATAGVANLSSDGQIDNWANTTKVNDTDAFVLENVGNVNVSLYIKSNKNATEFIMNNSAGGFTLDPDDPAEFIYMVRNCNENNLGLVTPAIDCLPADLSPDSTTDTWDACTSGGVGNQYINFGEWRDVNTTTTDPNFPGGERVCEKMGWEPLNDELRIDVGVTIPDGAPLTDKHAFLIATAEVQI